MFSLSNQLFIPCKAVVVYFTEKFRMGWREYCSGTTWRGKIPKKDLFVGSVVLGEVYPVIYRSLFNTV